MTAGCPASRRQWWAGASFAVRPETMLPNRPASPLAHGSAETVFFARWRGELVDALRAGGVTAGEVAEWLCLSASAYYKRQRGLIPFTAWEFVRLSERFGLSMYPAVGGEAYLPFATESLSGGERFDAARYVGGLARFAEDLRAASKRAGGSLEVSTTDLPIPWLFGEPALAAVKLFFFETENAASMAEPFSLAETRAARGDYLAAVSELHDIYGGIDSCEVWGRQPLQSFLYQLVHLARGRAIGEADAAEVFAALRRLSASIREAATSGRKAGGGRFELYQDRLHATNTVFRLRARGRASTFLTVDNPRYIYSHAPAVARYFGESFARLRRRSERVNGRGLYSGRVFGDALDRSIAAAEQRVRAELRQEDFF